MVLEFATTERGKHVPCTNAPVDDDISTNTTNFEAEIDIMMENVISE